MKITNRFDPTTGVATPNNTNQQNYLRLPFNSGLLRVFMVNPSAINIDIYFSNGNIAHLPARARRFFEEDVPSGIIYWQVVGYNSSIQTATPPFTFEIYESYEKPPQIYSDITPALLPFGQILGTTFNGTAKPTLTVPNVTGQIAVLDGFDVLLDNNNTTGSGAAVNVTVTNISASAIVYPYFAPVGAVPNAIDHVIYGTRGAAQVGSSAITVAISSNSGLSTPNISALIVKFHYEIPS